MSLSMDFSCMDSPMGLQSLDDAEDCTITEAVCVTQVVGPERVLSPPLGVAEAHMKIVHGTTTLAFKYKDGVIVAVDSRASAGAYIASQNVKKVIEINQFLVGTMAGGAADCQFWQRYLGMRCRLFELQHKERISVAAASKLLQNILYGYRGYGLSIGTMIAGWDSKGPGLFYCDSEGTRVDGNLFSVGSGSLFAYGILDSNYKYDMEYAQAVALGRRAIYHATHNDAYSGGTVRVYHIDSKGWRRISEDDATKLHYEYNKGA